MEAAPVKWTFQIGSLPRSGSAWMASLMNMHDGVYCFHDALQSFDGKYSKAPESVKDYPHRGDSSSYCCTQKPLENAVYVDRDWTECFHSLKEHGMEANFEDILRLCHRWACHVPNFHFIDIFGKDQNKSLYKLEAIFDILVPGVKLNRKKALMLLPIKAELVEIGPHMFDIEKIKERMN